MKIALLLLAFLAFPLSAQKNVESPEETMSRLQRWIEADADELAWQQIPWLEAFGPGIVAAHIEQKPLLLWVMNGHPLGCT